MNILEFHRISDKAVKLFFRQGLIAALFYFSPAVFCSLMFDFHYLYILSALLSAYQLFIHPRLEYRQWRYAITHRYVDIIHGIFFTAHTHIPISRIQHLDISQGPLEKGLGLASIVIVTAGLSHKIHGIDKASAEELLNDIRERIYEVQESV